MGKLRTKVGYAIPTEIKPGIWQDVIVEHYHKCDILNDQHRWDSSQDANDNLNISNRFSIVADTFAKTNRMHMKYIVVDDVRWKIHNIDLASRPRIIITVSGLYNGPEVEENDENP